MKSTTKPSIPSTIGRSRTRSLLAQERYAKGSSSPHSIRPPATGIELLRDAMFDKDTAFSAAERRKLQLDGLLPVKHLTI